MEPKTENWRDPPSRPYEPAKKAPARLVARYAVREGMGVLLMGVALFWSAGQIDWWPAWAFLGATIAWVLATAYVVLRFNPGLLVERLGPRQGAKAWDTAILSLLGVLQLGRCILAGLDQRFGWSPAFPLAVQLASLAVCLLGYALFVWAMASNAFFSQIVRVQTERGHTVARGGPYRWVRHPAYLGALVVELAAAGLLGSWWVLLVGVLNAGLFVLRAALEDRALLHELPGYAEYARQVRWRLLPGIW